MRVKDMLAPDTICPTLYGKPVHPIKYAQRANIVFPILPLNLLIREVIVDPTEDTEGKLDPTMSEFFTVIEWLMKNSNLSELQADVWTDTHACYTLLRRTLRNIGYAFPALKPAVQKMIVERYKPNLIRPVVMPDGFEQLNDKAGNENTPEKEHQLKLLPLVLHNETDFDLFQQFGYSDDDMKLVRAHCYRAIAKSHPYLFKLAMSAAEKLDPRIHLN